MRLTEFIKKDDKLLRILESATSGSSSAGSIASVPNSVGGMIRRMPTEPNLFGYVPESKPKTKKKNRKQK